MARLSDQLIDQIKQEVSLINLVEARGFALKPHGSDYVMCCPFHEDDTASLVITPSKNLWHCMGACQTGGSVIDWVMKTEGVSFRHAVELLQNNLPHLAAENEGKQPKVIKQNTKQKLPTSLIANADHQETLRQIIDYYHGTLKTSPEALEYLESRGLRNAELIDTFKLGYANRTLAYRLPQKNRQAGATIRGKLQEIGVLRKSGHEHFNGSIVIPVFDERGVITEVYGRKVLGKRLRKGTAMHTYLPGPHQGVWNSQAIKVSTEVILCESLIDAMTFWCAGFRNVTTSYGTSGFNDDHLKLFIESGVEKVLIAYDRDEAGNTATEKLAEKLNENGMDVYRVLFPKGMDANEYALHGSSSVAGGRKPGATARQVQPAQKSLGLAIRKAEWIGNGKNKPQPEPVTVEKNTTEEVAKSKDTPESLITPGVLPPVTLAHPCASPPLVATVETTEVPADVSEHEVVMTLDNRHYHVDTFDIYSARHRAGYIKQAAQELALGEEVIKRDLGKVLLKLEELQDQQIKGTLSKQEKQPAMSDAEVKEALALLKEPALLDRILSDFNRCGVVGEVTNKLVGYLAACSRKLDRPLAVMVQSSSAAGKSSLMDAILSFMPEEERIQYSAMTGQSLFYMGEQDLKNKILAIAEEEGAENTSYALKLLQSEGEVSIASTGKNATTGNLETQEYRVEGPVMLFSTTTAIDIDEELMNRCLVLSVDESRAQTQAIHTAQRRGRTLEGLKAKKEKNRLIKRQQNAQRLLRPLAVMNPYADQLTFLDDKTRTRRDHEKYLGLIDVIALLHQYQREVKRETWEGEVIEYIEVTPQDIATANKLAHEVLGRSLDELPPQTRRLLQMMSEQVEEQCRQHNIKQSDYRFSRKDVRKMSGWSDFQVKKHMHRLEDMEYVLIHRGRRGQSYEYELLYQGEGEQGELFMLGLIDTKKLHYDVKKKPLKQHKEPSSSPHVAPKEPPSSRKKKAAKPTGKGLNGNKPEKEIKSTSSQKCNASHDVQDEQVSREHDCMDVGGRSKPGARAEGCSGATRTVPMAAEAQP